MMDENEERRICNEYHNLCASNNKAKQKSLDERMPTLMKILKVGDELFATCSQTVFGTIHGINRDTVDIMVNDINDLIALGGGYHIKVEKQQMLICNIAIDYIGEFLDDQLHVGFETVDGCNRCVRSFDIRRDGEPVSGRAAILA